MYATKQLTQEQLTLVQKDNEIVEAIDTIKILSDDFETQDNDALELDAMVMQWLSNQAKKTKPTRTPKPKNNIKEQ
jgi:hypothetical protein